MAEFGRHKREWIDAISLATRDIDHAISQRDELVREAVVRGGLSLREAGVAARKTKGWAHAVVHRDD